MSDNDQPVMSPPIPESAAEPAAAAEPTAAAAQAPVNIHVVRAAEDAQRLINESKAIRCGLELMLQAARLQTVATQAVIGEIEENWDVCNRDAVLHVLAQTASRRATHGEAWTFRQLCDDFETRVMPVVRDLADQERTELLAVPSGVVAPVPSEQTEEHTPSELEG